MDNKQSFLEVPDSIFRDMLRRNIISLLLVTIVSGLLSIYVFLCVLEDRYCVKSSFNLIQEGEVIPPKNLIHLQFLGILKSDKVINFIIDKYNLYDEYGLDKDGLYANIKLDKKIFDDIKVIKESNGTITAVCVNKDFIKSYDIVTDIISFGANEIAHRNKELDLSSNIISLTSTPQDAKMKPKFLSILFLISIPVLLICIIFIAVKEKIYINLSPSD